MTVATLDRLDTFIAPGITTTRWEVPSDRYGFEVVYYVEYDPATRTWRCTCAGWRGHLKDCKHIKCVQEYQTALEDLRTALGLLLGVLGVHPPVQQ